MTNQWNCSQVTQSTSRLRCIVLHPVDSIETWRHFFIITLQSPWRHCSCNCAARLAPALVGWPEFLTDACGISIRQRKILPLKTHRQLFTYFLFETGSCIFNWHKWISFFPTYDQRGYHSPEQFKWCIPVMCSIQVYSKLSVCGFRH